MLLPGGETEVWGKWFQEAEGERSRTAKRLAWMTSHFWRGKAKRGAEEMEQKTWQDTVSQSSEPGMEGRAGVDGDGGI